MANIDANSLIQELEQKTKLKRGTLRRKGFKPFSGRVLEGVDEEDRQIILRTMLPYLEKSVAIAQERYHRGRQSNRYISNAARRRTPIPFKRDIEQAMLFARHDLLAADSGISQKTREFIEDHCPCA